MGGTSQAQKSFVREDSQFSTVGGIQKIDDKDYIVFVTVQDVSGQRKLSSPAGAYQRLARKPDPRILHRALFLEESVAAGNTRSERSKQDQRGEPESPGAVHQTENAALRKSPTK